MFNEKYFYSGSLIVFAVSFFVFYDSFLFQVWQAFNPHRVSDIPDHAALVLEYAKLQQFPAYSIWYRLVNILSGFSQKSSHVAYISIIILSACVTAKYIVTYIILVTSHANEKVAALTSLALIFVMPTISFYSCADTVISELYCFNDFHIYLGNIAPNQWHNSTLILAMPFNLLLFYYSVTNISSKEILPFFTMGVLSVISILCKPNYAIAFLPVLCTIILIVNIKYQQYLRAIIAFSLIAVPSAITLYYQWHFTITENALFQHSTKTEIAPFLVWSRFSPHITLSLILSISFPLSVLFLFFKKVDIFLAISWLTFLISLLTVIIFAEYPYLESGNFFWGAIAANYILFLYSARLLIKQPNCLRLKVAHLFFWVHFLSGCFLLFSFFTQQNSLVS